MQVNPLSKLSKNQKIEFILERNLSNFDYFIYKRFVLDNELKQLQQIQDDDEFIDELEDWSNELNIDVSNYLERNFDSQRFKSKKYYILHQFQKISDYIENLSVCSDEEIDKIYNEELEKLQIYNHENAELDLRRWLNIEFWTPDEAAAISIGKNPRIVNYDTMKNFKNSSSCIPKRYFENLYLFNKLVRSKINNNNKLENNKYLDYAQKSDVLYINLNNLKQKSSQKSTQEANEDDINHKTKHVYHRFIIGFAMLYYDFDQSYDPNNGSNAFKDITNDLNELHLKMNEKTVRTHLKLALEWFRSQETKHINLEKARKTVESRRSARKMKSSSEYTDR